MKPFNIANLRPSDAVYLKEKLGDADVKEQFLEQLTSYLGQHGACAQSLDNVFCAAVELSSNCNVVAQIGVEKLDEVFNGRSIGIGPRTEAFIEGLGSSYNGKIKLTTEQRRFTR